VQQARDKLTDRSSDGDNWTNCVAGRPPATYANQATGLPVMGGGLAYTLVLGDAGSDEHTAHTCMRTLQVLNPTARYANSSGFISTTVGTVNYSTPGNYEICFKDNGINNSTGTPGASFTVI